MCLTKKVELRLPPGTTVQDLIHWTSMLQLPKVEYAVYRHTATKWYHIIIFTPLRAKTIAARMEVPDDLVSNIRGSLTRYLAAHPDLHTAQLSTAPPGIVIPCDYDLLR